MIEREFVAQKAKEYYIRKYIEEKLPRSSISGIRLKKIPLGEKIIISTNRPSMIVGSKGANIRDLTKNLKKKFGLENPQIEIAEVKDAFLDAQLVAERIAVSLEKFGSNRFKSVGHKIMENVINSGALGVELVISGKIPGARAKSWRFYQGYLKKCGELSTEKVRRAQARALLKTGIIGIKVAIMPPGLDMPDSVKIRDLAEVEAAGKEEVVATVTKETIVEKEAEGKTEKKKRSSKKKEKKVVEEKTEKLVAEAAEVAETTEAVETTKATAAENTDEN
ncbi:30S ribosomal protein S3 [Candidatus Woesearchaeota archaeon]|nr:30S ribosomal protein S3 [Candidatus Woesearchaeota archaeon]